MRTIIWQEFKVGEVVELDADWANRGKITVVAQSPNRMVTRVKDENNTRDVMTNRLTKIKEEKK